MKIGILILFLGIALNLSGGVMMHYIPAFAENPEYLRGASYDDSEFEQVAKQFNGTIDVSSAAQDRNSILDNILDKLNIGIIGRVQAFFTQYMFGAVDIIGKQVLKLDDYMMDRLHWWLIIAYTLAVISLFTGKDLGLG